MSSRSREFTKATGKFSEHYAGLFLNDKTSQKGNLLLIGEFWLARFSIYLFA